jgi:hypothetical protein
MKFCVTIFTKDVQALVSFLVQHILQHASFMLKKLFMFDWFPQFAKLVILSEYILESTPLDINRARQLWFLLSFTDLDTKNSDFLDVAEFYRLTLCHVLEDRILWLLLNYKTVTIRNVAIVATERASKQFYLGYCVRDWVGSRVFQNVEGRRQSIAFPG